MCIKRRVVLTGCGPYFLYQNGVSVPLFLPGHPPGNNKKNAQKNTNTDGYTRRRDGNTWNRMFAPYTHPVTAWGSWFPKRLTHPPYATRSDVPRYKPSSPNHLMDPNTAIFQRASRVITIYVRASSVARWYVKIHEIDAFRPCGLDPKWLQNGTWQARSQVFRWTRYKIYDNFSCNNDY